MALSLPVDGGVCLRRFRTRLSGIARASSSKHRVTDMIRRFGEIATAVNVRIDYRRACEGHMGVVTVQVM
jgi:hypothetical protein